MRPKDSMHIVTFRDRSTGTGRSEVRFLRRTTGLGTGCRRSAVGGRRWRGFSRLVIRPSPPQPDPASPFGAFLAFDPILGRSLVLSKLKGRSGNSEGLLLGAKISNLAIIRQCAEKKLLADQGLS